MRLAARRRLVERHHGQGERLLALGAFAAGVARDVDNGLAAIAGLAEHVRETLAGEGRGGAALRDLDIVAQAAGDAGHSVRRLLAFANPVTVPNVDQRHTVAPDEWLADVVATTRPRWRDEGGADGRRIEVRLELGDAPRCRPFPPSCARSWSICSITPWTPYRPGA